MDRHLEARRIHDRARRNVPGLAYREGPPCATSEDCPFSLRDLLPQDEAALVDTVALVERLRDGRSQAPP